MARAARPFPRGKAGEMLEIAIVSARLRRVDNMHFTRRGFGLVGLVPWALTGVAAAQTEADPLPKGMITIVVPLAPAGPADVVARVLAAKLSEKLGRTFIVDNKAGAGGNLGAAYVAKGPTDGSMWLYSTDSVFTTNPFMYASQGFDSAKDLTPVARVEDLSLLLAVNSQKIAARNYAELIEESKKRALSFGSAGIGSPGHLALEYLKSVSPLNATHVPYRGAALAMQDLLGGQIDAAFIVAGVLTPYVKSGALRALAVSSNTRVTALPDVPTAAEAGIRDFDARFTNLMLAPSGAPKPIRAFMARQIAAVMATTDFREKLATLAEDPTPVQDEDEATAWIARERARWGKVITTAGIKAE
jgi:tripartite-type tricarboxylate transporter receptor subunit TctC